MSVFKVGMFVRITENGKRPEVYLGKLIDYQSMAFTAVCVQQGYHDDTIYKRTFLHEDFSLLKISESEVQELFADALGQTQEEFDDATARLKSKKRDHDRNIRLYKEVF